MNEEQLTAAIGAHARWKSRLLKAIEQGNCEVTLADTRRDDACQFGKWLYGTPGLAKQSCYPKVKDLHRQFHLEAAKVLELALAGKKDSALAEMRIGKPFISLSAALTQEIVSWRDGKSQSR